MTALPAGGADLVGHLDQLGVPIWTETLTGSRLRRPSRWQHVDPDGNQDRLNSRPPGAAICANMGHPIAVVDVDVKNGAEVDKIRAALDGIGVRIYADVLTPSGGRHYYVAGHPDLPTVHANQDRDGLTGYPGVEILSYGTNVFLPGSQRAKYDGAPYAVLTDHLDVLADSDGDEDSAEALAAWVATHRIHTAEPFTPDQVWDGTPPDTREQAYLNAAVRRRCDDIAAMGTESGRNTACFNAGLMIGNYVAGAGLDAEDATDQIVDAARRCGLVAEDGERSVRASIGSGIRLGKSRPRSVPGKLTLIQGAQEAATEASVPHKQEDDTTEDADEEDGPPPSWAPIDLTAILNGTFQPEQPTGMPRTDGHPLLYPGRVHSLHGESESGKSFIAQAEVARILADPDGGRVLFIDYESDQSAVVQRLLALGAPRDQIGSRFDYLRPEVNPYNLPDERKAWRTLLDTPYQYAVLDGVTEALVTYGAGSLDNDELTAWVRLIPRSIAQNTGAAVALIDHVVKNGEARGRFAIGGQAKLAALDGAAYSVEIVDPLGVGMRGVITLRVAKDRPGSVRPHAGQYRASDRTQEAARIVVDSTGARTQVTFEPPSDADKTDKSFRPTHLMEEVSRQLRKHGDMSRTQVTESVHGKTTTVRAAIDTLIEEGYITTSKGLRGATVCHLVKQFNEGENLTLSATPSHPVPPRPHPVPDGVKSISDPVPAGTSPVGGTSGTGSETGGVTSNKRADPVPTEDSPRAVTDTDWSDCNDCGARTPDHVIDLLGGVCRTCRAKGVRP